MFITVFTRAAWPLAIQNQIETTNLIQLVGLLGQGISQLQGSYTCTGQHKTENMWTDIHSSDGIRTHDPSI
jgi:hypothetical protein